MRNAALDLISTVESVEESLSQISEAEASRKPAPDKWSKKEVIGHLIDSASNNHQRFIRAQEGDVLIFPKYTQDFWVSAQHYAKSDWYMLLNFWSLYNRHLAHVIENINPDARSRLCKIGSNEPATLEFLVTDYVAHLKHHLKGLLSVLLPLLLILEVFSAEACADSSLVGLNTDGTVYSVDLATGALTEKAQEALSNFTLGGITRRNNNLYYVGTPSGSSENAIYKVAISTGVISHVDLDRAAGDDDVRTLFFHNKKLYGIFYNGTAGTAGLYRINPTTGVTRQIIDLSTFDVEPVGGAFTRLGEFFYVLVKPESNSGLRQLLRFRIKAGSVKTFDVETTNGTPVLCDRIKVNSARGNFMCLASPSTTQVDVCRLGLNGRATCLGTLTGVERIAGGHTMVTPNGRLFYAFVYAPGDSSAQRLIKFNGKGILKTTKVIDTIIIGAKFGLEDEDVEPTT